MDKEGIEKLAELSRMELNEAEISKMSGDINSILEYLETIKKAPTGSDESRIESAGIRNVIREDNNHHDKSQFTGELLFSVPEEKDGYIKVKKIL